MHLYFAGGYGNTMTTGISDERWLAESCGAWKRLVSFAEIDKRPGMFWFWVQEKARMELYFAGNAAQAGSEDRLVASGATSRLLNFVDAVDQPVGGNVELGRFWIENRPSGASVFLDSGAYGASTRGAKVDLGRYCAYIKEHEAALSCYAALDVIGDWRATAVNMDEMLKAGLRPVPTFHRGSPWEELDRLARDHGHIALGGIVTGGQFTRSSLQPFLDAAFKRLEKHWPVRVHVFGVITQWVLERYPFYSADSATAIVGAGLGRVLSFKDGQIKSVDWRDYVASTWDGTVADGVAQDRTAKGSAHAGRRLRNIRVQLALERYITDLWKSKGVEWSDCISPVAAT